MKAIFYKEWIKTKWYLFFAMVITLGFSAYSMLRINRAADINGMSHIWEVMISRDAIFINLLQYVPLLTGILLALVQFMPEMHHKCLKLTLHLPFSQLRMINIMLVFGVLSLAMCFIINLILMFSYLHSVMATELYSHILLTGLPWYCAGIVAYLLLAWIILEPTWKRRILNLIIAVLFMRIFFLSTTPEAYNGFLPWLMLYSLGAFSLSWLSVVRFKIGKQD